VRRRIWLAAFLACSGCLTTALAWAGESSTSVAALPASTATLAPPTAPSASATCPNKARGFVLVSWTASTSSFVMGYTVTRAGGAAFAPVQLPASATSYTDTTVSGATTYTYTVTATYQSWTAGATAAPVTTGAKC
jgi:hypothetical protein